MSSSFLIIVNFNLCAKLKKLIRKVLWVLIS